MPRGVSHLKKNSLFVVHRDAARDLDPPLHAPHPERVVKVYRTVYTFHASQRACVVRARTHAAPSPQHLTVNCRGIVQSEELRPACAWRSIFQARVHTNIHINILPQRKKINRAHTQTPPTESRNRKPRKLKHRAGAQKSRAHTDTDTKETQKHRHTDTQTHRHTDTHTHTHTHTHNVKTPSQACESRTQHDHGHAPQSTGNGARKYNSTDLHDLTGHM